MKDISSGDSTISECQRHLLLFWLGGLHLKSFAVLGFPHPVPHISEWGDFLPMFIERKEDNHAHHLIMFHQCMDQLDIHHEDVLMKMFMYSLEGDARGWYRSLPPSSISSLQ
jgi:hypothetical protein